MIDLILKQALQRRYLVLLLTLLLALAGLWQAQKLPMDAVPDITNVQVQINTSAPGYSPLEAEQRLTIIIENAMAGLPKLQYSRSLSRYGMSQVTVVFDEGTDIYWARQQVSERLQSVRDNLPADLRRERNFRQRCGREQFSPLRSRNYIKRGALHRRPLVGRAQEAADRAADSLINLHRWLVNSMSVLRYGDLQEIWIPY